MLFLRYKQTITRSKKGKKLYDGKETPKLPYRWQKAKKSTIKPKYKNNYVIVPENDLIVIDIDTPKLTKKMLKMANSDWYIVSSDNGTAHFYFRPTKKSKKVFGTNRKKIGDKIDLLQGKSIIFTPNKYNKTKKVLQGSLKNLPKIPKEVIKFLKKLANKEHQLQERSNPDAIVFPYLLKHDIENAFKLDKKGKNFKRYWYHIFKIITPSSYRHYVEPDYHPDKIPDGQGINYLQALSAKLAGDLSVDEKLHRKLIKFIAQKLWSDPLSDEKLSSFLSNLTTQTYSDGTKVFQYNPQIMEQSFLISENNSPSTPLYRTLKDEYIYLLDDELRESETLAKLKRNIQSATIKAYVNGRQVTNMKDSDILPLVKTIDIIEDMKKPKGLFKEKYLYKYNTIQMGRNLERLKNLEAYKTVTQCPKQIDYLLSNITANNSPKVKHKFIQFLAHKLTTYDYSPLIFQLFGSSGTGKGMFFRLLRELTNDKGVTSYAKTDFNGIYKNKLFIINDEVSKTSKRVIAELKELSGLTKTIINQKNVPEYEVDNTFTIILTDNNKFSFAEKKDDRRFVSLLSFNAPKLMTKDNDITEEGILNELDDFIDYLIYVQKTDPIDRHSYLDATYWLDEAMEDLYLDKIIDTTNHEVKEESIEELYQTYTTKDAKTIYQQLEEIFGANFKYYTIKDEVRIIVNTNQKIKGFDVSRQKLKATKLTQVEIKKSKIDKTVIRYIKLPQQMVNMIHKYLKKHNSINKKIPNVEFKNVA